MVTVRLELVQKSHKPLHIDSTIHPLLQPHFLDAEWATFCEDMDGALRGSNQALIWFRNLFFGGLGGCFLGFVLFITQDLFPFATLSADRFFLAVFFLCVLVILSNFFMVFYFRWQLKQANLDMEELCREWTYEKKNLNFHVRYTPNPIAWYLFHGRRGPLDDKMGEEAAASSFIEVDIKSRFALVGDRLDELEGMKDLLAEAEYNDLRAEILASVV
jgi:hypothetical protein